MRSERRRSPLPPAPVSPPAPPPATLPPDGAPGPSGGAAWDGELLARALDRSLAAAGGRRVPAVLVGLIDRAEALADAAGVEAVLALRDRMVDQLRDLVRDGDVVTGYGWNGWAAALDGLPARRDAELVAERLANAVSRPWPLPGPAGAGFSHQVTVSVGLATVAGAGPGAGSGHRTAGGDGGDGGEAVVGAERAARRAAQAGGDRIVVAAGPDREPGAAAGLRLAAELRTALTADQFEITWEPVAHPGAVGGPGPRRWAGRVAWRHPRLGRLHGPRYRSLLAEAGLGPVYAELVLERAGRWAAEQSGRHGAPVQVSIGIDPALIAPAALDVAAAVHRQRRRHGLEAGQLGLDLDWAGVPAAGAGPDDRSGIGVDLAASWLEPLEAWRVPLAATGVEPNPTAFEQLAHHPGLTCWRLTPDLTRALTAPAPDPTGPDPAGFDPTGLDPGPSGPAAALAGLARAGLAAAVAVAGERGVDLVATGVDSEATAALLGRLGVTWVEGRAVAARAHAVGG